jgi:hypothetical protein
LASNATNRHQLTATIGIKCHKSASTNCHNWHRFWGHHPPLACSCNVLRALADAAIFAHIRASGPAFAEIGENVAGACLISAAVDSRGSLLCGCWCLRLELRRCLSRWLGKAVCPSTAGRSVWLVLPLLWGCGLGTASAELGNLLNWAICVPPKKDGIYKFSAAEWNFSSN